MSNEYFNHITFPTRLTNEENLLLAAYARLNAAQKTLKMVKEHKKIEITENNAKKAAKRAAELDSNVANRNTELAKRLAAQGKLSVSGGAQFKKSTINKKPRVEAKKSSAAEPLSDFMKQMTGTKNNDTSQNPEHNRIRVYTGPKVTEIAVRRVFGEFGEITFLKLLPDKNPQSCLLHFRTTEEAVAAFKALNHTSREDFTAKLNINYCRKPTNQTKIKRPFQQPEKQEIDKTLHGRKMVAYDEEDLFD